MHTWSFGAVHGFHNVPDSYETWSRVDVGEDCGNVINSHRPTIHAVPEELVENVAVVIIQNERIAKAGMREPIND